MATATPPAVVREARRVIQVKRRRAGGVDEVYEVTVVVRASLALTDQELVTVIQAAFASAGQGSGQSVDCTLDHETNPR